MHRRMFLKQVGRGTLAVAVFGLPACGSDEGATTTTTALTGATTTPTTTAGTATTAGASQTTTTSEESPTTTQEPSQEATLRWERVNLGFVSAYVLVRNGEAAVVDTGNAGSEGAILEALSAVGVGWGAVGHVIVTHLHRDHQGSVRAVLEAAPAATGYAGEADIPSIGSPRPLTAVGDNDSVFGLDVIATPGHTPGHIAVHDPVARVLVAGDALNTGGGTLIGSHPDFTDDPAAANDSVKKMAQLEFDTLLVGHGEPIVGGAGSRVTELAASL